MEYLSGVDAAFLYLETPQTPMHVASLQLCKRAAGSAADTFYAAAREQIGARLRDVKVLGRKLTYLPALFANPLTDALGHPLGSGAWIEDPHIDLDYHVRRQVVPQPGEQHQLETLVAALHAEPLDRNRPLWQIDLIEGLAAPDQVAVYIKVHHAAVDGQAGVALIAALLEPLAAPATRSGTHPQPQPSSAARQNGFKPRGLLPTVVQIAGRMLHTRRCRCSATATSAATGAANQTGARTADTASDRTTPFRTPSCPPFGTPVMALSAPWTPLNVAIDKPRAWASCSLPLADSKRLARALGGTLNDLLLAVCSGALRRYLGDLQCLPAATLRAGVAVSLRQSHPGNAAHATAMTNQVTGIICPLATDCADARTRFSKIVAASAAAKQSLQRVKAVFETRFMTTGAPWLMSRMATIYNRLLLLPVPANGPARCLPIPVNVAISNVAGARTPLWLAGAEVLHCWPVSVVTHGLALNITVQSYCDSLDFGLTACQRALPDVHKLAAYISAAYEELRGLDAATAPEAMT